jgi:hypothetical protein
MPSQLMFAAAIFSSSLLLIPLVCIERQLHQRIQDAGLLTLSKRSGDVAWRCLPRFRPNAKMVSGRLASQNHWPLYQRQTCSHCLIHGYLMYCYKWYYCQNKTSRNTAANLLAQGLRIRHVAVCLLNSTTINLPPSIQ